MPAEQAGVLQDSCQESASTAQAGIQLQWLPWYVSDFYGSPWVGAMNDIQELWYRRLIDKSWVMPTPCFLPNDMELLAGMCKTTPMELQTTGRIVLERFTKTTDGKFIYNPRLWELYQQQRTVTEAKRRGGKARAEQKQSTSTPTSTPYRSPKAVHKDSTQCAGENQNQIQNKGKGQNATLGVLQESSWSPEAQLAPENLEPAHYARGILEQLDVPYTVTLLNVVSQCVVILAKQDSISTAKAADLIIARGKLEIQRGEKLNRFWFEDKKFIQGETVHRMLTIAEQVEKTDPEYAAYLRGETKFKAAGGSQ